MLNFLNFEDEFRRKSIPAAKQAAEASVEQRQRDVFESHRHRVFSVAFYMTGNELEAEDTLTQTFVRAFEQKEEPDGPEVDRALMEELFLRFPLLRARQTSETPLVTTDVSTPGPGRSVLRPDLEIAIQSLPLLERILFLLCDVEGYSAEAAGGLVSLTPTQARAILLSSRLRLRQLLAAIPQRSSEAA